MTCKNETVGKEPNWPDFPEICIWHQVHWLTVSWLGTMLFHQLGRPSTTVCSQRRCSAGPLTAYSPPYSLPPVGSQSGAVFQVANERVCDHQLHTHLPPLSGRRRSRGDIYVCWRSCSRLDFSRLMEERGAVGGCKQQAGVSTSLCTQPL